MSTSKNYNPAETVLLQLDIHIRAIKSLLNELEPSERLRFLNEMVVRLMPSRECKPASSSERLHAKRKHTARLTEEENALINKLTKDTDDLRRLMQDDGC